MGTLDGKVAVVTGAARGQGRAHALTLAREGADIVVVDIADQIASVPYELATPGDLEKTRGQVEELHRRVLAVQADVRVQESLDAVVAQAVAELGHVDILVANAGIYGLGRFWELTDQEWDDLLAVNVSGVWRAAKAVAPHMISRQRGSIVVTASVNAFEPATRYAHYVTAKHAVIGLMRSIALELAPYGVRCNAVCPGVVDTAMANWQGAYDMYAGHAPGAGLGTRDDFVRGAKYFHALAGRPALEPDDVASVVRWFVSDDAAHVTGVALPVDGGHLLLPGVNRHAAG